MVQAIYGETANDVWKQATEKLLKSGVNMVESRSGKTYELLHTIFSINDPRQRWVTYRDPPISIAFALAEVVWILNGSNDARVINYWNPTLSTYAGNGEIYHGAYGHRIRKNFGFDQMERAYDILKNNSESRQTVIQIWSPKDDIPDPLGNPVAQDIPCNICSLLKVRDSKLEWTQIIRSNDIYRGVPYNFVQYTTLQEILAGWLEIDVGSYTQLSDSLHLYQLDKQKLSIVEREDILNFDRLALKKHRSEALFRDIFDRMKDMSCRSFSKENLLKTAYLHSGYEAYDNILLVIAAYTARKMGYEDLVLRFIASCTNQLFRQIWMNWENHNR